MGIIIPLILIAISCVVIWRAGDGFMTASEYIGRNLSDGVRGASINAIASSMPEVFTSMFFLFVLKDASGFSGGIGTTAGSAIFNGMVIPAVSVIAVIGIGLAKRIEVSKKVMLRDGIALILTELIFLILISGSELDWYHGLILMGVYLVYIAYMFLSMGKNALSDDSNEDIAEEEDEDDEPKPSFLKSVLTFDLENTFIRRKITGSNAWPLLFFSTLAIALVCYLLVVACEWMGADTYVVPYLGTFNGLNIPLMFVALILASAASSFPDTIISIKDAQRGQYDDAISNALGSNIFDVCFALGFPLFLFTIIYGPIHMPPELVDLSSELRLLLLILTTIAVIIFTSSKYIGKAKAFTLLTIYILFVLYIIGRGSGNEFTQGIADFLVETVRIFSIR
ncbi:cation:H+ antiporter [Reichenbachiella agariperforans]|uniref:Cation:H+ antiporter n=1 Tax=Reichenbachiella agariperforans TaxID=156994 RepID=A0A1M6NBS9_REIAG|nr:pseudouridine synthase [Reichenbachiella agariperforans]SHJ93133.1 cation:H+ antiporter [Reichenbachiella agariperforans]